MKTAALTASDRTLVSISEETLHSEGAMLSLVLTKPNAKWLGALLSPAEAHQLALQLYEWAAGQDAAFRPPPERGPGEHQGSRKVTLTDVVSAALCDHIGCRRARKGQNRYCTAHLPAGVAP